MKGYIASFVQDCDIAIVIYNALKIPLLAQKNEIHIF